MQNLQNLQNLRALGHKGFNLEPLSKFDSYLLNKHGGVYLPMNEIANSVTKAVNPALATGRDIVINGDFANWTADDPDGWTVTGESGTDPEISEVGSGQLQGGVGTGSLNLFTTGSAVLVQQAILTKGKTYEVIIDVSAITGVLQVQVGSGNTSIILSTGVTTINTTAVDTLFKLRANVAANATIDSVTVKQTNILASTDFPGSEELTDGDMENAGVGDWTAINSATLTKETGTPQEGSQVLKVARNGADVPGARQTILTAGKRYRATGYARSDGNATPILFIGTNQFPQTTSTEWQFFDEEAVAADTFLLLRSSTNTGTEYTEWDDVSVKEVNPFNGDITGATVGATGIGDGQTAYTFDGANDYVDIYSAELNSIFDPTKGTLLAFAKVSGSGVWTDGVLRLIIILLADGSNQIQLRRTTTNNQLEFVYIAGGTSESIVDTSLAGDTDYFMVAMTWDSSGNMIAYINGVQVGTPQAIAGTWVGNLLSTQTLIGAISQTPTNVWDGDLTGVLLLTEVLSANDIAKISRLGGTS